MAQLPTFSFAAWDDGLLVGTLQSWPVALNTTNAGSAIPLIMVGPVAVLPDVQRSGLGRALMAARIDVADGQADGALMMIGDPEYYGRFFDFGSDATAHWAVPGPVERRRLLARAANGHRPPETAGTIGPDLSRSP